MRLGVSTSFNHKSPKEWADKMVSIGAKAVVFPVNCDADKELIDAYVSAAKEADLVIAEVGVWNNVITINEEERKKNIEYAIRQLKLADYVGAKCCVNIAGTYSGPKWDGGYRENYSKEVWDMTVKSIQEIIDGAKPIHTKYSIEPMPWMIPSSIEEYEQLIKDVDREAFGVHMDLINMINCPNRYFFQEEFMDDVFARLGDKILSCHLKDIRLKEQFTFQLEETACGKGCLNIEHYTQCAHKVDPDMPVLIEHLNTDEEYLESFAYVKKRLATVEYK